MFEFGTKPSRTDTADPSQPLYLDWAAHETPSIALAGAAARGAAMARECRRVLRAGGYVCIRTGTRENDVVVPNFFPAVRAMLDADFPSGDEVSSNFAAAGFTPRHHEIVTEVVAPDWPSFVRKSALRADSFLARLSGHGVRSGNGCA